MGILVSYDILSTSIRIYQSVGHTIAYEPLTSAGFRPFTFQKADPFSRPPNLKRSSQAPAQISHGGTPGRNARGVGKDRCTNCGEITIALMDVNTSILWSLIIVIIVNSRLLATFWPAIFWTQTDSPNANQKSAQHQVRCLEPSSLDGFMENPSMNWMRTGGTPMT